MAQDPQVNGSHEEADTRRRPWYLLPWILLVFLILFCCGQVALLTSLPAEGGDTRSQLRADYAPWAWLPMAPLDPRFLLEAAEGLGLPPIATAIGCLLPGNGCDTPTPTGTPATPTPGTGTPGAATSTPTVTTTPGVPTNTPTNEPPTYTPTVTNTPTQTPTPTPLVYPVKQASPSRISPGAATVDFTIRVINYGSPAPAVLTRLTDTLPSEMTYRVGTCAPACTTGSGQTVEWLGSWSIPQGSFLTFRFTADVSGTVGGEVLTNWIEAVGTNFDLAINNRRVTVLTPTPTATPVSIPVAGDDAYLGTEDTVLNVGAPGLLANDSDANGDPLSVQPAPVSGPSYGAVVLQPDGAFSYTPNADYYGADSFVYRVCDASMLCDTATVTITLAGTPDDPVAVDDAYTFNEDGALLGLSPGVRLNDRDPDDLTAPLYDTLTVSLVSPPGHQDPANPFYLNADGSFGYWPAPHWYGEESFEYQACDPTSRCDNATVTLTVRSVNDPPAGADHSVTTDEDVTYVFQVSDFPFSDPNDAPPHALSAVVISTLPASGTLRLSGLPVAAGQVVPVASITAGNLTYLSPLNANGLPYTSFTFRVRDDGGTALGGVDTDPTPNVQTINVTPVNDAPVSVNDSWTLNPIYIVGQGGTMVVPPPPPAPAGVLSNDTDVDDAPATLSAAYLVGSGPAQHTGGPFVLQTDGSFDYEPDPVYHGPDSFQYTACDPAPLCSPVLATVSLLVDDPPVSQPDIFTLPEDTALPPSNVLADNGSGPDDDPNGDVLTVQLISAPLHAAAFTLGADGSLAYTPAPNYNGPDSFQYRAFDGWLYGNIVSVGLTITPVNDRPEANPDSARTPVDTPVVIAVLANDTDVEGGPLRVAAIVTPPSSGGVVNNGASVTYTPNPGYIGNDSFVYQVCDPGADLIPGNGDDLCDQALVSVVVNGPPSGVDDAYSLAEDTTRVVAAPGVLANDTDPNGDPLTAVLISGPTHAAPLGFTFNANGSFSYRPAANYNGGDSFTYTVCDPDVCDATPPTTVTLSITPVQDAPIAVDDGSNAIPLVAVEDTPLDILVLANDSDPDGDPLSIQSVANPPHGTAVINNNGTPGDTTDDFVRYTPDWNYVGDDQFSYTISALGGTDTATIYVTVTPVNDPPNALDNWYRTSVNTLRSVSAPGVLGNDVDPEGDTPITASLLAAPGNGTLIPSVPCPTGLCSDGSFQYLPDLGYHGEDTFTYQACDPSLACDWATVTLSVNGPPTAEDDPEPPAVWSLAEDDSRLIAGPDVLANDTDPDLDVLELDSVGAPANGSAVLDDNDTPGVPGDDTILYTPDPDYFGDDSFTYRVCDPFNGCDQATITVRVLPVNDAPVAGDDPAAGVYRANVGGTGPLVVPAGIGVLVNDTDVDNAPAELRAVAPTDPLNGSVSLNADGSFIYTPDGGFRGPDGFSYSVCDPGQDGTPTTPDDLCDVGDVTILVNGVPVAIDDPAYSTNEDVVLAVGAGAGVLANDNEPDGDGMTATLVSGPAGLALHADGSFTYTPPLNFNSPPVVTFDYEACDVPWGACDTATASITVHAVNDAPTAANDSRVTDVGVPVSIFVLSNDTDVDLGDIVYLDGLATPPANGVALPNDNGTPADASDDYYDYQPNPGYISSPLADTFTYRITDGHGGLDTAFVSVTVNGPPVAGPPEAYATPEDTLLSVAAPGVLANDSDPNLDTISAVQVTGAGYGPFNGTLTLNADGSFSFSPAAQYSGLDSFTYQACDPRGLCSAEITVDLTVTPVNDPPVARDDGPYATDEDVPLDVDALSGLLGNDNDPIEGDPVTAVPASGTTTGGGSFTVAVDGSFSYVPAANFNGVDTFTYRAFDGTDPSAPATVTINVAPVNDPPVARDDSATTNQGTPVLINVVGNDYDVDGPAEIVPGSAAVIGGPASGSLVNNGDGTFTYTPAAGQYSGDSFTYTVDDIFGATSNAATVTIGIRPAVLQVLKEADPDTASLGETIDFYIYVWNNGPGTAYGVSLSDTLGSCFAFIGASPDGSLGDIAEGGAVVRTAQARVVADTACGDTNTAQVTAANASTVSDQVSVTLLPMGGGGAPAMALMETEPELLPPSPEPESEPTATPEPPADPTATPEPPADPTATPEPPADPTATPLVVAQGSLIADSGNPLGWVVLALTGIGLGRELVFRFRLPHATYPHRGTRYHEPATRPHRR